MNELDKDQLIQLISFYKQRASDLELEALVLQIKLNEKTLTSN